MNDNPAGIKKPSERIRFGTYNSEAIDLHGDPASVDRGAPRMDGSPRSRHRSSSRSFAGSTAPYRSRQSALLLSWWWVGVHRTPRMAVYGDMPRRRQDRELPQRRSISQVTSTEARHATRCASLLWPSHWLVSRRAPALGILADIRFTCGRDHGWVCRHGHSARVATRRDLRSAGRAAPSERAWFRQASWLARWLRPCGALPLSVRQCQLLALY